MPKPMFTDRGLLTLRASMAMSSTDGRGVGEKQVCASFGIEIEAADRFGDSVRREHVGARLDHEIGIDACLRGGADLLHHLFGGDDFLAFHVAAAFRPHLVLEHQSGDASALERTHGVIRVERVAVAGVAVGQQQQVGARGDRARGGDVLVEPHQPDVGLAQTGLADAAAGDERGAIAGLAHQSRAESVVHTRQHQDFRCFDERSEAPASARCHGRSSLLALSV